MTSPCCCGTSSCRLVTERRFPSTVDGSTWSTACPAVKSTSTSGPAPCFLMGTCGLCGLSRMAWTMPWRRLLTRRSPPCAHSTCQRPRARPSHCTRSWTALIQSGWHAWTRRPTSSKTTTKLVGCTWRDMPSTCSSCSTTPSASLLDSIIASILMLGRSNPLSRRLDVCLRSTVPCASS
jgi:hypothetical protein